MKKKIAVITACTAVAMLAIGCGAQPAQKTPAQSNVIESKESTIQTVEISGAEDQDTQGYITITSDGETISAK